MNAKAVTCFFMVSRLFRPLGQPAATLLALLLLVFCQSAQALPSFARQTGQSCVACHAGGQFPELTPYGRLFKLTGYSNGTRSNPFAAMVIGDLTSTRNNNGADGSISPKDKQLILDFGSVFVAGKITDNSGGFAQFTYTAYDHQDAAGNWVGHLGSDNFDLRYTDHQADARHDFIWGVTLHNNPTVQDVWNSSPAWGYPYVSSSLGAFGGVPVSTLIEGALAQQVAGIGVYAYLNKSFYAELTSYQTAKGGWSFLSMGNKKGDTYHPLTYMDGSSPYLRLALTHEWGAQNVMLGAFAMNADILPLDDDNNPIYGQGSTHYRDAGIDAQYQYLLAPHTFTAQMRYVRERINDDTRMLYESPASLRSFILRGSYVYRAKYGASLAFTNVNGSADATAYPNSASFSPDTQLWKPELFWIPMQSLRVGLQYNYFTRYLGAANNYDGNGRNASENNTTFVYLWLAL